MVQNDLRKTIVSYHIQLLFSGEDNSLKLKPSIIEILDNHTKENKHGISIKRIFIKNKTKIKEIDKMNTLSKVVKSISKINMKGEGI